MKQDSHALRTGEGPRLKYLSVFYFAFVALVTSLLLVSLALVRVRGGFAYPPGFGFFRILFFLQFGLFGGGALSILLWLLPRIRMPLLGRFLLLGIFYLYAVWLLTWGLVQHVYGIELTTSTVVELFTNPAGIVAMGLGRREFTWIVAVALALVVALTLASLFFASRGGNHLRQRIALIALTLFLLIHVPVRAYFVYHINRNHHVVLAYDDSAPVWLESEWLIPGLRYDRIALPSGESKDRTQSYFRYIGELKMPAIPRPYNILWINIESLRFDSIDERVMPRLFAFRDKFQIRLESNHWSGGNATQFGVFSMLTGLSGYQLRHLLEAKLNDPFLVLLSRNGYHLRVAKSRYVHFGGLATLPPSGTVLQNIASHGLLESDRLMIDSHLEDRRQRDRPAFDFVPFDSTHFDYSFPEDHAIFTPADLASSSTHVLLSSRDIEMLHNRYRNSCHFVDSQIGRVLDDLESSHQFDKAIVIICGDHGQEFQERGQLTHSGVLNDFQGRTMLWMHFPDVDPGLRQINGPTVHVDIVPTLLQALGFKEDVLYTQGRSLLSPLEPRPMLALCEQGFSVPLYRALVSDTYISRWWQRSDRYLFAGVQRRDGSPVEGEDWLREVKKLYPGAAEMYELLPDVSQPPRKFTATTKPL